MSIKKYINLNFGASYGKIANFTFVIDEEIYGEKSYREMYDKMIKNIDIDSIRLAFDDGVFAFKKSFGNQEDRKKLKGEV